MFWLSRWLPLLLGATGFVLPSAQPRLPTHRRTRACLALKPSISELLDTPVAIKISGNDSLDGSVSTAIEELSRRTLSAREQASDVLPYAADDETATKVWLLRFVASGLESGSTTIDVATAEESVHASIAWRLGEGRSIIDAARSSYAAATADERWNNDPVLAAAPYSDKIAPFVGPAKLLTLRNAAEDGLIYAIRAGQVDDKRLMASVTPEELADFFLYAKSVNERVCAALAARTNRLSDVVTVNDLSGVDLFGDASFRNALSVASKRGDKIFPGLAGPTILLNLPPLVRTLVKIFTPLFPASVQKRLKFAKYPLASQELFLERTSPERAAFLKEIDTILST